MPKKILLLPNIFMSDRIAQVTPLGISEAETVLALIELGLKAVEASPEALGAEVTRRHRLRAGGRPVAPKPSTPPPLPHHEATTGLTLDLDDLLVPDPD